METAVVGLVGVLAAGYLAKRAYGAAKKDFGCAGGSCEGCCGCAAGKKK